MKQSILIFFTFLTIYSFGQQQTSVSRGINIDSLIKAQQAEALGKPLASFTTLYQGNVFSNENLRGKTVFINFWFAACVPCIAEFDELNNLYDSLKNHKNFEFISFTFENQEVIEKITKKHKINYKVISLTSDDCDLLNRGSAFPTSLIIDSNGTIKFFRIGGPVDKKEVKKIIFTEYYPRILNEL